ncbi:MAG: TlpA disulfide reductase family protein [Bacteroidota bacterium]
MYSKKLKEGVYRAVLLLDEKNNIELPFNFEVLYKNKKPLIIIHNADERIEVDEIVLQGDSLIFKMPVFDTEFRTKISKQGLEGVWISHYRKENNYIKFKATYKNNSRFISDNTIKETLFEGKWEVTFSPNKIDAYKAIGLFHHIEQSQLIHGTFLTETGDYRYLEGAQNNNIIALSCFDGSHAFLFSAKLDSSGELKGDFYSGSHWKESWTAKKNNQFELKNAEETTRLLDANIPVSISFTNLEDKLVSLQDLKYKNKPVLIQIMGSWCPNCMDESAYLSPIYNQYKDQGFEIIALAFEKTNNIELAKKQLKRLQGRFNITYEILITGLSGKTKASELFPMLSEIRAFPTLISLNKQHQIVKIHTGFSGPATGKAYEEFKTNTESFIHQLINQ